MRDRFDRFVEWYGDMVDRGDKDCFDFDDCSLQVTKLETRKCKN